jgi:hypothetical protein
MGVRVCLDVVVKTEILLLAGIEARPVLTPSPYRLSYPDYAEEKMLFKVVKLRSLYALSS